MKPIKVQVLPWQNVSKKVYNLNEEFHSYVDSVMKNLESTQEDFVYQIEYPYGCLLMENGRMVGLENGFEKIYDFQVCFNDQYQQIGFDNFISDCQRSSDFPLSIIIEKFVELFSKNYSGLPEVGSYHYPLEKFAAGNLLGVWGTLDYLNNGVIYRRQNWDVSAGKNCIIPLLPKPQPGRSDAVYQTKFSTIFKSNEESIVKSIHRKINEDFDWTAKVIVFPHQVYDSSSDLIAFLYKIGWLQSENYREILWSQSEISQSIAKDRNPHLIEHIVNIYLGHDFGLKLVDENDGVLWEVFKLLIDEMDDISWKAGKSLLGYCFPFLFHYERLQPDEKVRYELVHSPASSYMIERSSTKFELENFLFILNLSTRFREFVSKTGIDWNLDVFTPRDKEKRADFPNEKCIREEFFNELLDNEKEIRKSKFSSLSNSRTIIHVPQGKIPKVFNYIIRIQRNNK